jgi:hypothetical protein
MVEVTNQNWQDVTVYVLLSGMPRRLGTVASTSTQTFALPKTIANATIQLIVAPVGSTTSHQTDAIMVNPGDLIVWHVENALSLSSYTVQSISRSST